MNESLGARGWDVIVVGGGAAGLSAALMLGRARRRVLVVDAGRPRNRFAEHMHGVLGHEGRAPGDLLRRGRDEVAQYGIEVIDGLVDTVRTSEDGVEVVLSGAGPERAEALVVATGVSDELPDVPGLAERWGRSVLHCPYCHGWEVADQRLAVLANSPMALHQARLLLQWSERVVLFSAAIGEVEPDERRRLADRGVQVNTDPVLEVLGHGDRISAVRTAGGQVEVDAIFTAATLQPQDHFLAELGLQRTQIDGVGSFLAVDPTGRTSHERIWAIGNVVAPMANVPMAIGAGALTGAAVNGWLVEQGHYSRAETPARHQTHDPAAPEPQTVAEFWESRYADADRVWSGKVNAVLAQVSETLEPGTALDLGCGEGGDAIWLASRGWQVTGVDLSPTAVQRAAEAATAAGLAPGDTAWQAADLATWTTTQRFDLVSASFLQSWPHPIPRAEILRRATGFVAPGGHLLVVSHAAPPSWSDPQVVHDHPFQSPQEDLDDLRLDPAQWEVVSCEVRRRGATAPDGTAATLDDGIVLVRRRVS